MPDAGAVFFELERFEWTADDRLVVVGRWNGVSGRRLLRPALTVEAGGRRTRVTGGAEGTDPWRATFDWDAARGDVLGAELELGRSLVVELPPPRRRRHRSAQATAETDLRAALAELKAERDSLRLELNEHPDVDAELAAARKEIEALRDERPDMRQLAASRADVERLTRELEALRADADASRADAERLASKVESLRADAAALVETRAELERLRAEAGDRLAGSEEEVSALRAEVQALRGGTADVAELAAAREEAAVLRAEMEALRTDAEQAQARGDELAGLRLAHGSLRAAHEQLEDELQRLRHEPAASGGEEPTRELEAANEQLAEALAVAREDGERLLAAERAQVARLREALLNSEVPDDSRVQRDLDREREATRALRRELEALRAEDRRPPADREGAVPASTAAGRRGPVDPPRRAAATRAAAPHRVASPRPSPVALWTVRVLAALLIVAMIVGLVYIAQLVMP